MVTEILENADLTALNTFGISARAEFLAAPGTAEGVCGILADPVWASRRRLVLGAGSNMLFVRDFQGLVLHPAIRGVEVTRLPDGSRRVRAGAGESWCSLVESLAAGASCGFERLALIPGSVGAAPVQNVGAYGAEAGDFIESVEVADASGVRTMDVAECRLGYRSSIFKTPAASHLVVTAVTFRLPEKASAMRPNAAIEAELAAMGASASDARAVFEAVCAVRSRKLPDPAKVGSAGSFFMNPVVSRHVHDRLLAEHPDLVSYPMGDGSYKLAAGWLIERSGLKGAIRGRAGVWPRQALVLVNLGGAAGQEILDLSHEVEAKVFERFGVSIRPETIIVK